MLPDDLIGRYISAYHRSNPGFVIYGKITKQEKSFHHYVGHTNVIHVSSIKNAQVYLVDIDSHYWEVSFMDEMQCRLLAF